MAEEEEPIEALPDDGHEQSSDDGEHKPTPYGRLDYWNDRYGTWAQDPFDWLFTYGDLAHFIAAFFRKTDSLLVPGCGNAPFSPDLFDAGYTRQRCVDLSAVVIEQQQERHAERCERGLIFEVGDCMALEYEDNSFDGVIDKSLVDTLMCAENSAGCVRSFLSEMSRLVKPGGFCMFLSLHKEIELLEVIAPELHPKERSGDDEGAEPVEELKESPFRWVVSSLMVPNPSKSEDSSSAYSIGICQKWVTGDDAGAAAAGKGQEGGVVVTRHAPPAELQAAMDTARDVPQQMMTRVLAGLAEAHRQGLLTPQEKGAFKAELVGCRSCHDIGTLSSKVKSVLDAKEGGGNSCYDSFHAGENWIFEQDAFAAEFCSKSK